MKKSVLLVNISFFFFMITCFFDYIVKNNYYMLLISIIPICMYILNAYIKMDKENYTWVVFIIFSWISALVSVYSTSSYKFLLMILIVFSAKLIYESVYGWHKNFDAMFFFGATVHSLAVLLCIFIPDTMHELASHLYTGEVLDSYFTGFDNSAFAGLTTDTALTAYFVSVFLAHGICGFLNEKKSVKNILIIIIGILCLFLTLKRSFLITNLAASCVVFILHNKVNNKKISKNIIGAAIVVVIVYIVLSYIPEVQNIFLKNDILMESGDITNGRISRWTETIELWKKSPIFGQGIASLPVYYGVSSHNTYLQVLAETGVIGFVSFVVMLITSFAKSCKKYRYISQDNKLTNKERTIFLVSIYLQTIFILYCFVGNPIYNVPLLTINTLYIACIKSYKQE